jgi:hypothetical protein
MPFTVSLEPGIPDITVTVGRPTDGSVVLGQPVDMNSSEGRLFAHIWGHQPRDQQHRASAWTHLQEVPAGDKTYDLRKLEDMRAFLADLEDGHLDGKADNKGFQGVSVTADGKVMVGDKAYNLTNPADMHALLRDNADGRLDARTGAPVADEVEPPVQICPDDPMPMGPSLPLGPFVPVGFPAAAPATPVQTAPVSNGKPNNVMYGDEIFDVNTEEGREALGARLAEAGIDYDEATNEVSVGDRTYSLDTEKGRRAFLKDGQDGLLDGKWGDNAKNVVYDGKSYNTTSEKGRRAFEKAVEGYGVEYDRCSNKVKVDDKSYDLDTEKGRRAFQQDLKDGVLDGKAPRKLEPESVTTHAPQRPQRPIYTPIATLDWGTIIPVIQNPSYQRV